MQAAVLHRCCMSRQPSSGVASMFACKTSMLQEQAAMFASKQRCCIDVASAGSQAAMFACRQRCLHRCLHAGSGVETVFAAMLSTRGNDGGGNPARSFWIISYFPY